MVDPKDRFIGRIEDLRFRVDLWLTIDERPLLRGILLDFMDVMGDEPAEAGRVALARRIAEALR